MPAWPNTDLGPGTGAYHSSELPVVFGTTALRAEGKVKDTPEEAKVVKGEATSDASHRLTPMQRR
jgi:carboxylesterase type B